ncbi:hypothetical protein FJTKL_11219 [Diaporthe vaccinii]|uniref:NPP1 domain-containing protein n=1 Tax=Diaporthe vaccinii TaxID=105482 RepID=A0ABR4EHM3_9PEZI
MRRDGDVAVGDKWKNHDDITPFQQYPAHGAESEIELLFKPGLNDGRGCFPYAAVDRDGYHGSGLKPTGDIGERCRDSSKGQMYARVGSSNNRTGVLYSWYLPKVQSDGENHKHYYLSVAAWLYRTTCNSNAHDYTIAGVSYSTGPETWDTESSTKTIYSGGELTGTRGGVNTHPVVGYDSKEYVFPSADSAQYALSPPLIDWGMLPTVAKEQLNGITYEHARCPFTDANFQASLDASFSANFYSGGIPEDIECASSPPPATPTPSGSTNPESTSDGDDSGLLEDDADLANTSVPPEPTYTPTPQRLFV